MRRNSVWNILFALIFALTVAAEAFAVYALIRLDMLPLGYLIGVIVLLAAFAAGIGCLLFRQTLARGKGRKIIACILSLLLICSCMVIATVAGDVIDTLAATSQQEPQIMTREVYVRADNPVEDLEDTASYTFGYIKDYDEAYTEQVLDEIAKEIEGTPVTAGYTNIFTMINALLEDKIDAMILNGGYTAILEEMEEFSDFSARTRVLKRIRVDDAAETPVLVPQPGVQEQIPAATENTAPTKPAEEMDFTELKPFIVYLSGSDSHEKMLSSGRSDVNILAVVNPMTKQVLLLNTPRDYYVRNSAGGGARDKLTHCGLYGVNCSMTTLGNLYDAQIDYYAQLNFTGFKKLIDALGGITVYSDYAFTAITRTYIQQGENQLTGQQALDFARERYTLRGGDNERGRHQMMVIEAVIKKATNGTTIISNYSEIMESIEGMFTMNIPMEMVSALMKMQLTDMAQWNIVSYAATGRADMEKCYTLPGMELSVLWPNDSSVSKASRLIDMVFAGEILTEEVINSMS